MKPGTFTQFYVQLVFSPKNREPLLRKEHRKKVWSYLSQTLTNKEHKSITVNGMPDHVHIFLGLNPKMAISDLVRDLKRSSSLFINEQKWFSGTFNWQEGYGVFSYGRSQIDNLYQYIMKQEEHHKNRSLREGYMELLRRFEVEY